MPVLPPTSVLLLLLFCILYLFVFIKCFRAFICQSNPLTGGFTFLLSYFFTVLGLPFYLLCHWSHVFSNPDVCPDDTPFADCHPPEDGRVRVHYHVVFEYRMARYALDWVPVGVERKALRPQRNTLVQLDVVAYDACRAYYNARAVVDGEMVAYLRRRMNVYPGLRMGHFCYDSRNERHAEFYQLVGYAVVHESLYHGVARYNLALALGGGVAVVCRLDVGCQHGAYLRQALNEPCRQLFGLRPAVKRYACGLRVLGVHEAQPGHNLVGKNLVHALHVYSDMVIQRINVYRGLAVETGKQYRACKPDNLFKCLCRG